MNFSDQDVKGILSQWDSIESEIRIGLHEDFGKSKNIQDILDIIHELQVTANTVSPLKKLLQTHVDDQNNPHRFNMSLGELELLNVLYSLYISRFGVDMTLMEFGYALINIKRFATKDDIDNQTHLDNIVNVDVFDYMISKHDQDPLAHNELFRYRLPGNPITYPPSDIIEPNIAINNLFTVVRNCPICYHDINGRVLSAPVDKAPTDYAYGIPACPIFGPHRNILLNSRVLSEATFHGSVRSTGSSLLIVTPTSDANFLLLQEEASFGSHGFLDIIPEEITGVNTYVIYYYPIERTACCINIMSDTEIMNSVLFDCEAVTSQNTGNITRLVSDIQNLPSGWFRFSITFDATGFNITGFDVNTIKSIDTANPFNPSYQGEFCNAGGFWQHQLTDTSLPVPPIFTENEPVQVLGTKLSRAFGTIFNPIRGTVFIKYLSPMSELFGTKSGIVRFGQNSPEIHTALNIETNPFNTKRNRISSYNVENDSLTIIDSQEYSADDPRLLKRIVFTYGIGVQGYGFTDQSPNVFRLGISDIVDQIDTFFTEIYDASTILTGVKILQLPSNIISPDDTDETIVTGSQANTPLYRINMDVNVFELGYNSLTDKYLDGYLLSFRYYSVFASEMNIEFLLDQYTPNN